MTFEQQIEAEHKRILAQRDNAVEEASLDMYSSVVKASPVDSGELRDGWELPKKIADGYIVSNIAPHAYVIDGGRRLYADGVVRGSEQLPDGYAPIIKEVEERLNKRIKEIK